MELEDDSFENQLLTEDTAELIEETSLLLLPVSSSLASSSFPRVLALRAPAPYLVDRDDEKSKSAGAHLQLELLRVQWEGSPSTGPLPILDSFVHHPQQAQDDNRHGHHDN